MIVDALKYSGRELIVLARLWEGYLPVFEPMIVTTMFNE